MESLHQKLNPWISIWLKPRRTIQQIVDSEPTKWGLLLVTISGISQFLDRASMKNMGDHMSMNQILLAAVIVGPIIGIIGLYLGGVLIRWTGKWLNGKGDVQSIRAAIAWSNVPVVWAMFIIWIPELIIFGKEMFTSETPVLDADLTLTYQLIAFASVEVIIGIWTLVIYLKTLGYVQGFSVWKALGNTVLAVLAIVIPAILLAVSTVVMTH